ncbi:MAG: RnfABCDGE type electron transport complex subunit D [Treponema sp.]|nr:RnfABCDGE type electron transport complex subunit D [Treponema sp.]
MSNNAAIPPSAASGAPAKKTPAPSFLLQSSPHIASPVNTAALMRNMLIALSPVSVFGIVIFGLPALLNIVTAVCAAVAAEALFRLATKQEIRIRDLSAGVTGLLLALVIPPSTPLWMTALGAVFGVVVAKEFFGGLGANVFNPALIGRAFLLMSFPAALTRWHLPQQGFAVSLTDATSGATPLAIAGVEGLDGLGRAFAAEGSPASYWAGIKTLFFGCRSGCTGESAIFLILIAFVFLLVTKTIDWRAPVSMIAAALISSFAVGLDPLFSVLSGGLVFGAVFMATDYVTAPLTAKGKVIFGIGAGVISILIRKWGSYPEGVSYAILIMNGTVPFLNKLLSKKYGFVSRKKGGAGKGAAK